MKRWRYTHVHREHRMGIRRQIRAFQSMSLLVVVSMQLLRPQQLSLLGGIGRFTVFLILASLLLFVVSYSTDIGRAVAAFYRAGHSFLFAVVLDREPVW